MRVRVAVAMSSPVARMRMVTEPLASPGGGELVGVEVLVVGVAEEDEDFDVGEALVREPFVDVMDVAQGGNGVAAGVFASQVACPDGELLDERRFPAPADVLQHLTRTVLEAEVQVTFDRIEQWRRHRYRPVVEHLGLEAFDVEHNDRCGLRGGDPDR